MNAGDQAGATRVRRNYGDPAAEYDAARNAAVVADRGDRRILRVYGRDPVKMVQGLVTNDVASPPPERAVYAAVLTPKGKMVADLRVIRDGDELLLECDAAAVDALAAHLRRFVPPLFARFEPADDRWAVLGVYGPRAAGVLQAVFGVAVPADAGEDLVLDGLFAGGGVRVITTAQHDVPGFDVLLPAGELEHAWSALVDAGARPAGHATLDVLRIEAGRPRWGAELDENTIPLEAGLRDRAISETKGCYTGQEVIVRILHRGHVNWLLRTVRLGDVPTPARDTPLFLPGGEKRIGRITSAAWSPKHGGTIALAYVRREVEPPAELRLGAPDGPPAQL